MEACGACPILLWALTAPLWVTPTEADELAPGIVGRIAADGSREVVVDGTTLRDTTPEPEPAALDPSPLERKRGYVLFRRQSDKILGNSRPQPEERVRSLSASVSLGESRHVQFAVHGIQDLGHVRVSVTPLVRQDGTALPDNATAIRPVRIGLWRDYWTPTFQEAPKLIDAPGTGARVAEGGSQQYWVTIHAPETARPGKYSGEVRVEPDRGQTGTLQLRVTVLPFRLDPGRWWGVYYYPGHNADTPRDFADMKAHGVNAMLVCPPAYQDPILERDEDGVTVSFPLADRAMTELKRQGFRGPIAHFPRLLSCQVLRLFGRVDGERFVADTYYGSPAVRYRADDFPEDLRPVLMDVYRQMVQHAREADWPDILWYLVDEPENELQLEWAKLEYPLFAEACPNEPTLCTAYSDEAAGDIGVPLSVRVIDLWRIQPGTLERAERGGTQVWGIRWLCQHNTYGFPRHYAGLGLDKIGVGGFTEWTYYGAPLYEPYGQLKNKEGCYYAYTDAEGRLLSTTTWEGVQKGIADARYVATLRRLIDEASASRDPRRRSLAASAQPPLDDVMARIPSPPEALDEAGLDEVRATVASQIVKLIRAGAAPAADEAG